jgi:hypothetical protein
VSIVADALAHGQKVLVVCQKKAALDVVASRLRREEVGLGGLFVQVDDAESDRRRIIEMLRDQGAPAVVQDDHGRAVAAEEIERLEKQFEEYANALFRDRGGHGVSYRTMLGRIARIERECEGVRPLEALREGLREATETELARLADALARLEELFWTADVPANPWVGGREGLTETGIRSRRSLPTWSKHCLLQKPSTRGHARGGLPVGG